MLRSDHHDDIHDNLDNHLDDDEHNVHQHDDHKYDAGTDEHDNHDAGPAGLQRRLPELPNKPVL